MKRNFFWLLLLLPAFPALSDSLITCEPVDISGKVALGIIGTFFLLGFFIITNLFWSQRKTMTMP